MRISSGEPFGRNHGAQCGLALFTLGNIQYTHTQLLVKKSFPTVSKTFIQNASHDDLIQNTSHDLTQNTSHDLTQNISHDLTQNNQMLSAL